MMKPLTLFAASLLALPLTACGNAEPTVSSQDSKIETPLVISAGNAMDHSNHSISGAQIGHGTGIIKSLSTQGDFLTINHGPIEGVGMSAMTMGFDIMGGVDLSTFTEGDAVAFMVKRGRDNSYRITAICNTDIDGDGCLNELMDH